MYTIRKTQTFYGPRTIKGYVLNPDGSRFETKSKATADAKAYELDGATYYCAQGEIGRAEYKVVRI